MINRKMFYSKVSASGVISNTKTTIRCCSSNAARLTNLLKVMKKEPGRATEDLMATVGTLSVFKKNDSRPQKDQMSSKLWSELEKEELKLFNQKPPTNGFQEMINWTNEGKLWQFPIDNEQGLDEVKKEKFYDHVFFDDLIEASPDKAPIREFMNDAALGLSKNPYLTAERKRQYLQWYNDYFNENKELVDTMIHEEN